MRALSGPGDLVATVADRFGNHPWARLCAASTPAWSGGEDRGDAVVWRSAHPWSAAPELHALGPGAGAAVEAERRPGEAAVSSVPAVATGSRPHGWTLRLRSTPGDLVPGEDRVTWLDDDRDVTHLLAAANDNAPGMRLYDRLGFDAWPMLGWSDR